MNSRSSGDRFEYHVVHFLELSGVACLDDDTKQKRCKLLNKFDIHNDTSIKERIVLFKLLNKCIFGHVTQRSKITHYKLTSEYEGKNGSVADIVLVDDQGDKFPISCKKNNMSVKHQRPSNLDKQLHLTDDDSSKYRLEYKQVNDEFYNKIKECGTFNKICREIKDQLYTQVNDVVMKYINDANTTSVQAFYKFLLSVEEKFILQYNDNAKQLTLYDNINVQQPTKMVAKKKNDNYLIVECDNGVTLSLRLHNASSKVTKSLSLKYDTKILDATQTYKVYTFK